MGTHMHMIMGTQVNLLMRTHARPRGLIHMYMDAHGCLRPQAEAVVESDIVPMPCEVVAAYIRCAAALGLVQAIKVRRALGLEARG